MSAPVIDWVVAEWIARRLAGTGEPQWPRLDLAPITADAEGRVVDYTGLVPSRPLPPAEGVSRREWVASNIASTRALLDPMIERAGSALGPAGNAAQLWLGTVASSEVGLLIGYLAQRVLGQYELVLIEPADHPRPPRLLFVLPNLGEAIRKFGADEHEFMTWVALHEVTHAVQFGSVGWLQGHLAALIGKLVDSAEQRLQSRGRLQLPSREALARFGRAASRADLIGMLANDSERATIDEAQTVMAVIEGHAEHVMDAVAPELLPSLPQLRAAIDARRRNQSPLSRVIARLLGLELKLRQYEQGKAFCDAIVAEGGQAALRHLFSAPTALPSPAELEAPRRWLERTNAGD